MEKQGTVTLARINKGSMPNEVTQVASEGGYYYLPEAAGDKSKVGHVLKEAGFKLGDRQREHTPEPGEEVHVTLLSYTHHEAPFVINPSTDFPSFSGDGGFYYYLPGKDHKQMVQVLEEAGFETGESLMDVIDAAFKSKGDN